MKMSGDSKEKVHRYEKIEFLGEVQVLLRIIELVILKIQEFLLPLVRYRLQGERHTRWK